MSSQRLAARMAAPPAQALARPLAIFRCCAAASWQLPAQQASVGCQDEKGRHRPVHYHPSTVNANVVMFCCMGFSMATPMARGCSICTTHHALAGKHALLQCDCHVSAAMRESTTMPAFRLCDAVCAGTHMQWQGATPGSSSRPLAALCVALLLRPTG
jgi:hypothetical protein